VTYNKEYNRLPTGASNSKLLCYCETEASGNHGGNGLLTHCRDNDTVWASYAKGHKQPNL
jgi:hypothetical protein